MMTLKEELRPFMHATFDQMTDLKQRGLVNDKIYGHWLTVWQWSVNRDNSIHRQFYNKYGCGMYWRRIDRIKQVYYRLLGIKS